MQIGWNSYMGAISSEAEVYYDGEKILAEVHPYMGVDGRKDWRILRGEGESIAVDRADTLELAKRFAAQALGVANQPATMFNGLAGMLPLSDDVDEQEMPWLWRNCRAFSIGIRIHVWPWYWHFEKFEDYRDGSRCMIIGPLQLDITYGLGNASSENSIHAATALHEMEAYDRAQAYVDRKSEFGKIAKEEREFRRCEREARKASTKRPWLKW